jgi:peptidoglycan DL-endopeptidase CwlO
MRLRLALVLFTFLLAGLAPQSALPAKRSHAREEAAARVTTFARKFVGVPYRYGGSSPRSGFDCSGFVAYVYRHFGVRLPHYTVAQFGHGLHVRSHRLRPGDLLFFNGLGHVGLYVGRGRFLHAPNSRSRVRVDSLRHGWYASRFDGARRIVRRGKALRIA